MKKLTALLLVLSFLCVAAPALATGWNVFIDASYFPDSAFWNYISDQFDSDRDGRLSTAERNAVTDIYVEEKGISSLQGIEWFPALQTLDCSGNRLTGLDLRQNASLTYLDCSFNQLLSLNVGQNALLEFLRCDFNGLMYLDLSRNPALRFLSCAHNGLTGLDLRWNGALEQLFCSDNGLVSLDLSRNPALKRVHCYNNSLASLNTMGCSALTSIVCYNNALTGLAVSQNPGLQFLECGGNPMTSLDVSWNTSLSWMTCDACSVSLEIPGGKFDLSSLPGFNVSKASKWKGGKVSGSVLTVSKSGKVTYTYDCGNRHSATFTLNVTVPTLAAILEHPQSVTVEEGEKATFRVKATGDEIKYQWYYQKPGETTWNRITKNGTSASYTVTTEARHNGYSYRCNVTCKQGTADSNPASLTVISAPAITAQPQTLIVTEGTVATFTVAANGEGLTYQWYYRKPNEAVWNSVTRNGTAASYSVTAEARHNGYQYRCLIQNTVGSVYSRGVSLGVNPGITAQPSAVTVAVGQTATFKVVASGTRLSYQWFYQKPGETAWNVIRNNGTSAAYSVTAEARHNGYHYRCQITNSGGGFVYSNPVQLTVK